MMRSKYRGGVALIYLCLSLFSAFFIMATLFSILGYWIGNGEDIIYFFIMKLSSYFKVALAGPLIGIIMWFFYYR